MERGQIVELKIEDMSAEGQGIGRAGEDGLVVFVKDAVPGDVVRAQLTKVKKNYAFGRLEEVLKRSEHRNEEFDCPYFNEGCGGCPMSGTCHKKQEEKTRRKKINKTEQKPGPVGMMKVHSKILRK